MILAENWNDKNTCCNVYVLILLSGAYLLCSSNIYIKLFDNDYKKYKTN